MIKPNNSIVLIKTDGVKTQDDDGILISEQWQDLRPTGTVVAIGDDVAVCKVGDKVFFERYTSIPTPFGEDVRACRDDAILAIYEDGDAL
jgi:co-chaperonin GroES (HSP10)